MNFLHLIQSNKNPTGSNIRINNRKRERKNK